MGDIEGLAASMVKDGKPYLIEPIVVRTTSETGIYKVLAGRRRFAAAQLLGWTNIEAVIMDPPVSDEDVALDENVQRLQMSPVEVSRHIIADLQKVDVVVETNKVVYLEEGVSNSLCVRYNMNEDQLIKHINLSLVSPELQMFVHSGKLKLEAAIMTIGMDDKEIKRLVSFCSKSQRQVSSEEVWEIMESGDIDALVESGFSPDCLDCQFRGGKDPVLFEMMAKDGDGDGHVRSDRCYNANCRAARMKDLETKITDFAKENGMKKFNGAHTRNLKDYGMVEWPLSAKDQAKCKGCSNSHIFIHKGKFKIGCSEHSCEAKNFNSKAKKMQDSEGTSKMAVGGQEEKKPSRPVSEKLEMKVMLGLRRALMADAERYINQMVADKTRANDMVARVGLYFGWDRDLIGGARINGNGKDKYIDQCMADWDVPVEDTMFEIGLVILQKQTAELIGRIKSRVDTPNVTWKEIDYQATLLMNRPNYCMDCVQTIVGNWKDKAKVEWNEQSRKGKNGWKLEFMPAPLLVLCEGDKGKDKPSSEEKPADTAKSGKKQDKKTKKTPKPPKEPVNSEGDEEVDEE
jgi:hypothetical protein